MADTKQKFENGDADDPWNKPNFQSLALEYLVPKDGDVRITASPAYRPGDELPPCNRKQSRPAYVVFAESVNNIKGSAHRIDTEWKKPEVDEMVVTLMEHGHSPEVLSDLCPNRISVVRLLWIIPRVYRRRWENQTRAWKREWGAIWKMVKRLWKEEAENS